MSHRERAKKKMASKFAGSKPGQAVIIHHLGDEGAKLVKALTSIITNYKGKKVAKEWKKNVFKFALKAGIMFDSGKITIESVRPLQHPLEQYAEAVLNAAKPNNNEENSNNEEKEIQISPKHKVDYDYIIKKQNELCESVLSIMSPHMQEKNVKLLKETMEFGDFEFAKFATEDSSNSEYRKMIYSSLYAILKKADIYAPGTHQVILSQSQFSDKYSTAITVVLETWSRIENPSKQLREKSPRVLTFGELILEKMCQKDELYKEKLKKCKFGEDFQKQGKAIVSAISTGFRMLNFWQELSDKLKEMVRDREKWAPDIDLEKGSQDFVDCVLEALKEVLKNEFGSMKRKWFKTIMELMVDVMKSEEEECCK